MQTLRNRLETARIQTVLIFGLYLVFLGTLVSLIHRFPPEQLTEILKTWVPWNLRINALAILCAVIVGWKDMAGALKHFLNRRGAALLGLLLLGFLLACFVSERTHRIYFDEDIYLNIGQNIAVVGQTGFANFGTFEYGEYYPHWIEYNKEPSGWPFLVSIPFQLLGTNEIYGFLLNNLLFASGILLVFLITRELTGRYGASMLAALIYTLIPHNLIWHNTAAAEPSAAFFAALCVFLLLVTLRTREDRHLFLLLLLLPMAAQMRPESSLLWVWTVLTVCLVRPEILSRRKSWAMGLATAFFILPHLLHIHAMSGSSWGAEGPKFGWDFFLANIEVNGLYYLKNTDFPVLFTLMALVGLVIGTAVGIKQRLMILVWFLLFWGIFLFFYAGSYRYGADVRFALLSFAPLSVLAGIGGGFLRDALASRFSREVSAGLVLTLLLAVFMGFLPMIRMEGQEAWGARYDHKYARQFAEALPHRSVILTQIPTMFLLWGYGAIQTHAGVTQPELIKSLIEKYQGNVFFHYNFWCNAESKENKAVCQAIGEHYGVEQLGLAREQNYEFGLYRITLK